VRRTSSSGPGRAIATPFESLVVAMQAFGPNADREADMARLQAAAQPLLASLIVPAVIVDN
jgi:hypothetical protein